jgi:tetratricopeptide (TPR) repeat protein
VYNLIIAIAAALATLLGVKVAGFSLVAGIVPALVVLVGSYILLARRISKKLQALGELAQKELMAQRVPQAIKIFEQGFAFGRWQFFVGNEIHANIGMLQYIAQEFDKARPNLEKSMKQNWVARAMLACLYFRDKDHARMETTFEDVVKAGKKEGLAWSAYAWCLDKANQREKAIKVLVRAVETNPTDDKLKANLTALQNDKKLKMRAYTPQWYQFHLEKPPAEFGYGGRRVVFQRR